MSNIINHISTLTHDDLADWVEEKILTRGKSLVHKVRQKNRIVAQQSGRAGWAAQVVFSS